MTDASERLADVQAGLTRACRDAGRSDRPLLVAVSKTFAADDIRPLIAAGQPAEAVRLLKDHLLVWRSDPVLWRLLSKAHEALAQRADAHRAVAEQYLLLGSPMQALDQLRRAQKAGDTDFYSASVIDARIAEIEPDARREFEETRQQGPQR